MSTAYKRDNIYYHLADPGGGPPGPAPKGPDSFVLTYNIFET